MPDSISPAETSQPKRRSIWRHWSLRTLFVVVAICGMGLAWASYQLRLGQLHREVGEKIRQLGARAEAARAQQVYLGPISIPITDKRQSWLKTFGAENATSRVGPVVLSKRPSGKELDQAIDELSRLDSFPHLSSYGSSITQAHLARLLETTHVDTLYLEGMPVDRHGIPCLKDSGVLWLLLARTQFSDPGIDDLPDSLEFFNATRTRISDEGLDKFVRLKNLKGLILRRTPTSEAAVDKLREKMPWCEISWELLRKP